MGRERRGNSQLRRAIVRNLRSFIDEQGGPYALYQGGKSGLAGGTVKNWTAGRGSLPSLETAAALANYTGLSLDWLVTGKGPRLRGQIAIPETLDAAVRAHIETELRREAGPDEVRSALRFLGREGSSDEERAMLRAVETRRSNPQAPEFADVSVVEVLVNLCRAEIPRIRQLRRQLEAEWSIDRDAAKWRRQEQLHARTRAWVRGEIQGPMEKRMTVRGLRKLEARRRRFEKAVREDP